MARALLWHWFNFLILILTALRAALIVNLIILLLIINQINEPIFVYSVRLALALDSKAVDPLPRTRGKQTILRLREFIQLLARPCTSQYLLDLLVVLEYIFQVLLVAIALAFAFVALLIPVDFIGFFSHPDLQFKLFTLERAWRHLVLVKLLLQLFLLLLLAYFNCFFSDLDQLW